jgi:hypothetical protein
MLWKVASGRMFPNFWPEQMMGSKRPDCRRGSPNLDPDLDDSERLQSLLSGYGVIEYHLGPGPVSWV